MRYAAWREHGCCNGTDDRATASAVLANTSLLSFLYPRPLTSLAIATVHTLGPKAGSAGCGIVKWCFSATTFAESPLLRGGASVVVLTNNASWVRGECRSPQVRIISPDPQLELVVRGWSASRPPRLAQRRSRPFRPDTLMKWQLFALTDYNAILYTDVDVDLFLQTSGRPPPPLFTSASGAPSGATFIAAWTRGFEAFLRSSTDLIALRDPHVPINTAAMLLRPSQHAYALGLATLQTRRFNFTHGFNLTGRPRDVLPLQTLPYATAKRLRDNTMARRNTWDVVCGDSDQGLFVHVFLVLLRGETFAAPERDSGFAFNHFFGWHKVGIPEERVIIQETPLTTPPLVDSRAPDSLWVFGSLPPTVLRSPPSHLPRPMNDAS